MFVYYFLKYILCKPVSILQKVLISLIIKKVPYIYDTKIIKKWYMYYDKNGLTVFLLYRK